MTITVHRAERRKAKLRLALTGPSGSGKTFGALQIAKGLAGENGRILLIDTERGSGEFYADMATYDIAPMEPPYRTEKYIEAIRYAEDNGYDCVILDSISHAWAGQGGILDQNREIAERTGNSFSSWAKLTPKQNQFVDAILNSRIHVIATMRSKTEYVLIQDINGRSHPEKRATAPIQRDGIDYEFTLVFDVAPNHTAEATKDRSGMFNDAIVTLSEDTGRMLKEWLETGTAVPAPAPAAPAEPKPPKNIYGKCEVDTIRKRYEENGWPTRAIDDARIDAATWDADAINADFKKRNEAPKRVCPQCGRPSMTEAEAKHMEHLAETTVFDHNLCKDCCSAWYAEHKNKQKELNAKMPKCIDCGKPVVESDAVTASNERYGIPLCRECLTKRIAKEMKAKHEQTEIEMKATHPVPQKPGTEISAEGQKVLNELVRASKAAEEKHAAEMSAKSPDVCSICGRKMSKAELSSWILMYPEKPPVCDTCAAKQTEN